MYVVYRRHLKHVYFTVLERFSVEELQAQKEQLWRMEMALLAEKRKGKDKRRTLRRQR
jgi:hypothetical protein